MMIGGIPLLSLVFSAALQVQFSYAKRVSSSVADSEILTLDSENLARPGIKSQRLPDDDLNDEMCHSVLRKLVNLIKFDDKLGIGNTDEQKIMKDLVSALSSSETLSSRFWLDRILSIESLAMMDPDLALEADEVITISDLNILNRCAGNNEISHDLQALEVTEDGIPIIQGDIAVPVVDSLLQQHQGRKANSSIGSDLQWAGSLWTNGVVPWCFHPKTATKVKDNFRTVLKELEKRTCLEFRELPHIDRSFPPRCSAIPSIIVQSHQEGCWSYVGNRYSSRSQELNLEYSSYASCASHGIVAHEVGHAIGLEHEQARMDRDDFVTIHWNNIQPKHKHNFNKRSKAYADDRYDIFSLMHYGQFEFSIDRWRPTISCKKPEHNRVLGQRVGFSAQDILQINRMYQCKTKEGVDNAARWCMGRSLNKEPGSTWPATCHSREFCLACESLADVSMPSCSELRKRPEEVQPDKWTPCRGPHTRSCLCHLTQVKTVVTEEPSWSNLWNNFGTFKGTEHYSTKQQCAKKPSKVYYNEDGSECKQPQVKKKREKEQPTQKPEKKKKKGFRKVLNALTSWL